MRDVSIEQSLEIAICLVLTIHPKAGRITLGIKDKAFSFHELICILPEMSLSLRYGDLVFHQGKAIRTFVINETFLILHLTMTSMG
mmetsp:Transcript_2830/g.8005  ORF Transcript_2830/g.8005 Transcript_2830/m.8005 type:complete len:86 (+) Transcript_2830:441-698(+)